MTRIQSSDCMIDVVIDLARLISGYCPSAYSDSKVAKQFFASLTKAAEWDAPWDAPIPKSRETNVLLTLRTLANAFHDGPPVGLDEWVGPLLEELGRAPYDVLVKNHRIALATLLFKYVFAILFCFSIGMLSIRCAVFLARG